jgi:phage-related minor tail protein|nr:MAG TPA: minor tail protein [Caudoviricetes sp.]
MAGDSTTRMRVDLSELKKEFKDAQRQIQLVNSEFKAATAGMTKWADNADGLSAKIEQLNGVLAAETTKLQSLEDQYKLVAQEQGENSRGAQELLIKINNQKAAIERTQAALTQYGDRLENIQSESERAATATEQLQSKIADQQGELDNLKSKYADLVVEQGESSDEAQQLADEIQALSQELRQNERTLGQATQAADDLGEGLDDAGNDAEDSSDGFTVMKGALADLVADGIREAISALKDLATDAQEAYASFQASTGVGADAMREFKHEMDDLYANNYGENLQDLAEKMAYVKQATGEVDPSKIRELTENAIAMEDTFGSDFSETIRGVNNLMQHFELTAEEAFDLFAKGSQEGLDYTDELGDNIAEYGGNFKQAGYSAEEYFQLLKNGTKGGAYNLDKVNDSINEIKNRLADGTIGDTMAQIDEKTGELKDGTGIWSEATEKAFKAWQKGEGKMKDVIDSIVSDISDCKDEQEALTMASTAFGTMGEDANLNVIKSLTTLGEDFTNVKGKMEEVKDVKYDTVASSLETIKRAWSVNVVEPIAGPVLSSLIRFAQWFPQHIPAVVTSLASVGTALLVFNASAIIAKTTAAIGFLTGGIKALGLAIAANPWGAIVAGVAAIAAGIAAYTVAQKKAKEQDDENLQATKELTKSQEELNEALEDSKQAREENNTAAETQNKQADIYADRLEQLAGVEEKSAAQKALMKDYVDKLNEIMPDLNLKYDEEADKLNMSTEAIKDNIKAQKDLILAKAAQANLETIAADIAKLEIEQADIAKQHADNELALTEATKKTQEAREAYAKTGYDVSSMEHKNYIEAVGNEGRKRTAYEQTKKALEDNKKSLKDLNDEYNNTEKYAQDKLDASEMEKSIATITEKMRKKGVEIPEAVAEGMQSGQYVIPEKVKGMKNLIKFDELAKEAGLSGTKIPENLAKGISNNSISAKTAIESLEKVADFDNSDAVKNATTIGIKIPESLRKGIASGKTSVDDAVKRLSDLTTLNKAVQNAGFKGLEIPKELSKGILKGKVSVEDAQKRIEDAVNFRTAAKKSGVTGKNVINAFVKSILSGEMTAEEAGKKIAKASTKGQKTGAKSSKANGAKAGKDYADGVESKKGSAKKSGQNVGKASTDGEKAGAKGAKNAGQTAGKDYSSGVDSQKSTAKKSGQNIGQNTTAGAKAGASGIKSTGTEAGNYYAAGLQSKTGAARESGSALGKSANNGADSYRESAKTSGGFFGQGFINGIGTMVEGAFSKAYELAKSAWNGLKKGQQEGSPSKLTYQSGVYFTQGYINGIASEKTALIATVKDMVKAAVTTMAGLTKFNFSKVAEKASNQFSTALSKKLAYINNKIQYLNDQKTKELEKKLTNYETAQKTAQTNYNKTDTKLKSTEKSLASAKKKYNTAQENYKKAKKKYDSATKATQKANYKEQMQKYKKQMQTYKKEADADKKSIGSLKKKKATYKQAIKDNKELVKDQKEFNEAYTTASSQMLSEFSEAMSDYQTKAQALIDETINGIETKYQEKYDALIEKQNTLISKLKSAGDLFEVSGAGIMTINDIEAQTQSIKDYANKLQKIKSKVSSALFDQIASYDMNQGEAFMDRLLAMDELELKAYSNAYDEKMKVSEELAKKTYQKDFENVASEYKDALATAFKDLPTKLEELGKQAMAGFVDGLKSDTDYMTDAVKTLVSGMVGQFQNILQIHSPSKVMEKIGAFTGESFGNGLYDTVKQVQKQAKQFISGVTTPLEAFSASIGTAKTAVGQTGSSVVSGPTTVVNNYNLVQNNTSPKALSALDTYRARRQQVSMVKAMTQPV